MPWGLKRFQETGQVHYITFSCYRRRPNLRRDEACTTFLAALERVRRDYGLRIYGYVVMPEHVHLLLKRAGTEYVRAGDQVVEAGGGTPACFAGGRLVLAGALLRLQRLEREEVCGEAAVHSSEPGKARTS
jgi:hypothetical protein